MTLRQVSKALKGRNLFPFACIALESVQVLYAFFYFFIFLFFIFYFFGTNETEFHCEKRTLRILGETHHMAFECTKGSWLLLHAL